MRCFRCHHSQATAASKESFFFTGTLYRFRAALDMVGQKETGGLRTGREVIMNWRCRVRTSGDAVRFIDTVGYCLLFPIKNVPLPSLYYAMARREPVTWDDYAARLWNWKDNFPRRRQAFYTKYFHGRGTFISLKLLPDFLAMEGASLDDFDQSCLYAAGRITADACLIWKTLEAHGPLATLELRHACKMESQAGNKRYKRAILELSRSLIVVHFGAEQETGAWASSRFELTERAFPEEAAAAKRLTPHIARKALAKKYLAWHPDAKPGTLARLFRWSKPDAVAAMR